jgi:hypothetical protein
LLLRRNGTGLSALIDSGLSVCDTFNNCGGGLSFASATLPDGVQSLLCATFHRTLHTLNILADSALGFLFALKSSRHL